MNKPGTEDEVEPASLQFFFSSYSTPVKTCRHDKLFAIK